MIDDPNIEHEERPEYDENGELIWYPPEMDIPDEFTAYNFTIENDPYAKSLDDEGNSSSSVEPLADEEEDDEYINITNPLDVEEQLLNNDISEDEGQLNEAEDKYNESVESIIELLTKVLEAGEITAEDNANLLQAEQDMATSSETIKNICANQPDKSLLQTVEELKENMVGASIDDILDILTDGGTKPWLYKDDDNNVLMDGTSIPELTMLVNKLNLIATGGDDEQAEIHLTPEFIDMVVKSSNDELSTQYKQLSDKFTWLVKSGDSQSTMVLTDKMYELISNNITLTAEHINLNGYVSNDDANWSIDKEGNIEAKNLNVEGSLSADKISCNELNSANYPKTLSGTIDIYVNSSTGNDDNELEDEAKFATLQGVIDKIPKFMNGKTVRITLQNDVTENISLLNFACGTIRIYLDGKTIYGTVRSYGCSSPINIYGGTQANTTGATGKIHPSTGLSFASRSVSMGFESSTYIALYKLIVYAPDKNPSDISNTDKVCVGSQTGTGCVYCNDVKIMNAAIGFRSNNAGHIQAASTRGIASKYGFQAATGGIIGLHNDGQAGGVTANTNEESSGKVFYDSPIFDVGASSSDPGTAPTPTTTKTLTIKSSYGDTYRSSVYNNWKKDNTVRQGDYGYGDCNGCWFFGTAFADVKGKTITKIQITISRQTGGTPSAVGLVVRTHAHTSRPSGSPTLSSSSYGTLSLATGASGTLTITNSTVLAGIKDGTIKGFGIKATYDASHYAVCSGSCTVKITYQE